MVYDNFPFTSLFIAGVILGQGVSISDISLSWKEIHKLLG